MNQIIARRYTSDKGEFFTIGMNSEVAIQDAIGGSVGDPAVGGAAADAGDYPLPRQMKPRRVKLVNPAGKVRYLPLLEANAPLATPGTQVNLEDSDGVSTVFTSRKVLGEQYRERNKLAAV